MLFRSMTSEPSFKNDGVYANLLIGVGGAVVFNGNSISGSKNSIAGQDWGGGGWLGATLQVRNRLRATTLPLLGWIDSAGIPDTTLVTWVMLGVDFAP